MQGVRGEGQEDQVNYPLAIQVPGHPSKVYSEKNSGVGVILHSMEGYWSYANDEVQDAQIPLSWHFSVLKNGVVEQHYPLSASCWHAGNKQANTTLIGIEHEGVKGEPLTEAQVQSSLLLVRWVAAQQGWEMERGVTMFEHNEINPKTTCPNGRIPWERYTDTVEVAKIFNAPAIAAVKEIVQAVGGQNGEFIGKITSGYPVPSGYTAYLVVSKDG